MVCRASATSLGSRLCAFSMPAFRAYTDRSRKSWEARVISPEISLRFFVELALMFGGTRTVVGNGHRHDRAVSGRSCGGHQAVGAAAV